MQRTRARDPRAVYMNFAAVRGALNPQKYSNGL